MVIGSELNINIFGFLSKHRYVCVCIVNCTRRTGSTRNSNLCAVKGTVLHVKPGCDSRKDVEKILL